MEFDYPTLNAILTLSLKGAGVLLLLVFCLIGFRIFRILGSTQMLLASIQEIVDMVSTFLLQPAPFYTSVLDRIRSLIGAKK